MEKEQQQDSSVDSEEVVCEKGVDGAYAPQEGQTQKDQNRPIENKEKRIKRRTAAFQSKKSNGVEDEFVDGFRQGFKIIRGIGKVLKVKL